MIRRLSTAALARAVRAGRAGRAVGGLWPDRNPLRRSLDRAEAVIFGGLAVAFLVLAPLSAITSSHLVFGIASRVVQAERSWRLVPAVLLADARPSPGTGYATAAQARWTAPDGSRRTGAVPAPPDAKAGSTVRLWVTPSGRLTRTPLQPSQARGQAVLVAICTPAALGLLLLAGGGLAHRALGRRRLAAWDIDWQATEPQWTRPR
jgi:hypothetical protein